MDLIIKNLERLKDYSDGNRRPIKRVVVDFDKLATEDFAQVFFDACEEYKEPSLKEATEHMQSEFDATGKDVKIFMNGRVIKR